MKEVTKTEEVESFFNFFKSRKAPEEEENDKEIEGLENDLDIAEEILDSLIPQALFYYMDLSITCDHDKAESENSDNESDGKGKSKKSKSEKRKESKTEAKKDCKQQ